MRTTPQEVIEYAMTKSTRLPNGCLVWDGWLNNHGYGMVQFGGRRSRGGQRWYLHRLSYFVTYGEIGALEVGHRCHDESECTAGEECEHRRCWEPTHLYLQTHRENMLAGKTMAKTFAAKTQCPQGHPYDEKNTYVYRGGRQCHTCRDTHRANHRARMKAR